MVTPAALVMAPPARLTGLFPKNSAGLIQFSRNFCNTATSSSASKQRARLYERFHDHCTGNDQALCTGVLAADTLRLDSRQSYRAFAQGRALSWCSVSIVLLTSGSGSKS